MHDPSCQNGYYSMIFIRSYYKGSGHLVSLDLPQTFWHFQMFKLRSQYFDNFSCACVSKRRFSRLVLLSTFMPWYLARMWNLGCCKFN